MPAMKITLESRVDPNAWAELTAADPSASFFHEPVWVDCLAASFPHFRRAYFLARDDAGSLVGGIPAIRSVRFGLTQLFSLPYGTYGTPLVRAATPDEAGRVRRALVRRWVEETRRPGLVRAHLVPFGAAMPEPPGPLPPGGEFGGMPAGWRRMERTHLVDLTVGWEALWSGQFDGDKRTEARKAQRLGVSVRREPGPAVADVIEGLYRRQSGAWRDHTPFPPGFLHRLVEAAPDRVAVWVARHEARPVAAEMVFHHRDTATVWLTCGETAARRLGAGNLIYSEIMEDACRRGLATFNLGGSRGRASIEAFKEAFGSRPVEYATWLYEAAWFRPLHRLQYRLRGIRETG